MLHCLGSMNFTPDKVLSLLRGPLEESFINNFLSLFYTSMDDEVPAHIKLYMPPELIVRHLEHITMQSVEQV